MVIEKRIKLNKFIYYIGVELKYDDKNRLRKKDDSYFDNGDFSYLIENIENSYKENTDYDKNILHMNNIIFIYDRFPFLLYIKQIDYDKNNQITNSSIIYKNEILDYINKNNIKIGLFDGKKSVCPLLFK